MVSAGDLAPDFELPDQDGQRVTLSSLRETYGVIPKVSPKTHDEQVLAVLGRM